MTLTYNSKDRCFVLITKDKAAAEAAGLTHSTRAKGPNGEEVYFTADHDKKPTHNPYAVLTFFDEADSKAKEQLQQMKNDYDRSWATFTSYEPKNAPEGRSYLPYQKAGIEYGVSKGDVLVGDEPGLGKTVQAIGICNELELRKVLVVCPASIRINWRREYLKWSIFADEPDYGVRVIKAARQGLPPFEDAQAFFLSYELAKANGLHEAIMSRQWDAIIIDEAHYLKTTDAQRTRAIFGGGLKSFRDRYIAKQVKHIISLTGTPLPNRPRECYTLANAICPESIDWMSYDNFCFRFNPSARMEKDDKVFSIEKRGRLPELHARLRTNFMIRRLKKDVLKDLPDKRYEITYLEPDGAISEILQKEKLIDFSVADLKNPFSAIWGMVSTVRREMGEAKVPRVVEHIKYLFDIVEVPKIVLFAHHKSVMDALAQHLAHYGVVQVRGGMSNVAKDKSVQDFQTNPKIRIFMGQLEAAGFGIDGLQNVCDHVVFAEPAWTPGTNEQAVDRCHRIGQHNNVLAQFLVVEGSFDEKVLGTVFDKNNTIHKVLDKRAVPDILDDI